MSTKVSATNYPCVQQMGNGHVLEVPVPSRVECFFIGQKLAFKKRSGMILEVQIQNFGSLAYQSFHFQKTPGGLNIDIFL